MTTVEPADKTAALDIRLFGKWMVLAHGEPLPRLRARAGQSLLALLVLRADAPTERNWLAATLWPDSDEEQALYNLRRNLTDLRAALGSEARRIESPAPRALQLNLDGCFCDVHIFDAAARPRQEENYGCVERAVSLYRGPLLEGFTGDWVGQEREARAQMYLSYLETLAKREAMQKNWQGAARCLRLAVAADAYNESAQCALMEALASAGDMAAATLVYRNFRLRLHEDLQTAPTRATTELYQRLQARARQVRIPTVPFAPLLAKPDPALNPAPDCAARQSHLPQPVSDLVGRVHELREITLHLRSARLVTLLGTGGIGKTRLAIAAAEQAATRFSQEAWFVDLAPLASDAHLEEAVAGTLGVRAQPGQTVMASLIDALRERPMLLVLDNCEHVVHAAAQLARDLLQACPDLRILATSRQSLNIAGEVAWRVPSLSMPSHTDVLLAGQDCDTEDIHTQDFMRRFDAARLFVERARQASPNWTLNSRKLAAIVSICRRVDGIPLALELAAARVKALSVEQIAQRLDDAFSLLTGCRGLALPRHQTLRAATDWSYDLLTEDERRLLAQLSAFAGGWTLDAAELVCGDERLPSSSILDTLSELVDKSLVLAEEDADGQVRYRLLETIRQYGQEKLYSAFFNQFDGDAAQMLCRHYDYYLALAQTARKHLTGPQQAEWLNRLEADHDNLRSALRRDANAEKRLYLATALTPFWKLRGHLREGVEWLTGALKAIDSEVELEARAQALNGVGTLAYDLGDFADAAAYYEQSLAIHQKRGDSSAIAHLLVNLGNIFYRQGNHGAARSRYAEGLELFRGLGQGWGTASALGSLGNIEDAEGNFAAARALQEESLALSRSLGDTRMTSYTLHNLGSLAVREGASVRAEALFEESLAMKRTLGDRRGIATTVNSLALLALEAGDHDGAGRRFAESLTLAQEIQDKFGIYRALDGLATLASARADLVRVAYLSGVLERCRDMLHIVTSQEERDTCDGMIETVRQKMPAAAFDAARNEGYSALLEHAVREALREVQLERCDH